MMKKKIQAFKLAGLKLSGTKPVIAEFQNKLIKKRLKSKQQSWNHKLK